MSFVSCDGDFHETISGNWMLVLRSAGVPAGDEDACRGGTDLAATAFTSSPWAYNGRVFMLDEEGKTYVIAAGEKFELLRTNVLEDMTLANPGNRGRPPAAAHRTSPLFDPPQQIGMNFGDSHHNPQIRGESIKSIMSSLFWGFW
jgi:hypothetical protein